VKATGSGQGSWRKKTRPQSLAKVAYGFIIFFLTFVSDKWQVTASWMGSYIATAAPNLALSSLQMSPREKSHCLDCSVSLELSLSLHCYYLRSVIQCFFFVAHFPLLIALAVWQADRHKSFNDMMLKVGE
jgi:hypothetical protein